MTAGPVVRVAVELADYRPVIDDDDLDWRPVAYTVHAHHAAQLTPDAVTVRERRLERLTLDLTNDEPDAYEDTAPATLELPGTIEGIEALALLIDAARDYLVREMEENAR